MDLLGFRWSLLAGCLQSFFRLALQKRARAVDILQKASRLIVYRETNSPFLDGIEERGARMKRVIGLWVGFALLIWSWPALAVPLLQLDIGGGFYSDNDPRYENNTVVSSGDVFTLYALMQKQKGKTSLKDDYFISIALYPNVQQSSLPPDLGSFTFAGQTIYADPDLTYGNPGISPHGVFDSYYILYTFHFDEAVQTAIYNSQDNPGANFTAGTGLYYAAFEVNTAQLSDAYSLHFDLFNNKVNAPFSHDAQSDPPPTGVPEPATLLLLGLGIIGVAGYARRCQFIRVRSNPRFR